MSKDRSTKNMYAAAMHHAVGQAMGQGPGYLSEQMNRTVGKITEITIRPALNVTYPKPQNTVLEDEPLFAVYVLRGGSPFNTPAEVYSPLTPSEVTDRLDDILDSENWEAHPSMLEHVE